MNAPARGQIRFLPDGRRLHLQDGPIDLIIEASGPPGAVAAAYDAAMRRFASILDELCGELPALRSPDRDVNGSIARTMQAAVRAVSPAAFITPMAAVAGAVADEMLRVILDAAGDDLDRAYVNNGGDIALHLARDAIYEVGLVSRPDRPTLIARTRITVADGIGGIATSGAPGRSFSLGVADSVTTLAATAALADAAATVIANAVDLPGDARIHRVPAYTLQPDSDLGERLVTRSVAPLDHAAIRHALRCGAAVASGLISEGMIIAAALHLQGRTTLCGTRHLIDADAAARKQGAS